MSRTADCRRARRERSDGAVAIMVGLLATALFGAGALAVDLGNTWAREREAQKQVDVTALSVGWMLPMTPTNKASIAQRVADYLNDQANDVVGQSSVTANQLINNSAGDGELIFQTEEGASCVTDCPQMRVIAPPTRVDYGLAGAMGLSHGMVQAAATVRIASELPPMEDTIPFWLPSGCGFGPTQADTTQGNGNSTPTPTATATATPTAVRYTPSPVGSHNLQGNGVTPVAYLGSINVSGYWVTGVGNQYKKVTLRAYPPTGSNFVDFAAQTAGNGAVPTFQVSTEVSSIPGDWYVYALAQKNNSIEFSNTHLVISVADPQPDPTSTITPTATLSELPVVGCVGQDRGNFGQLDTPRLEGGTKQARLAKNIALGIDHLLAPYQFAPGVAEQKSCGSGGTLLPGAQLDDLSRDGNNCIVGDTGNDGPKIMDGLIQGISGVAVGRLDVANGHTTCPGRSDYYQNGTLINNDVLSCYLRDGATLSDIASATGVTTSMLDKSVMDSPRFVWLPVVYATDRAQKDFQPIRHFVPGFITDETQTSGATASNGLEVDGNSVKVLRVFTFNRDALPPLEDSDTTDYSPEIRGGIVRLVG